MITPYLHSWGFNILQAAERQKQQQMPPALLLLNKMGSTQPSLHFLLNTIHQLKFSTYFGIKSQPRARFCCARCQTGRQIKKQSILSKDCRFLIEAQTDDALGTRISKQIQFQIPVLLAVLSVRLHELMKITDIYLASIDLCWTLSRSVQFLPPSGYLQDLALPL